MSDNVKRMMLIIVSVGFVFILQLIVRIGYQLNNYIDDMNVEYDDAAYVLVNYYRIPKVSKRLELGFKFKGFVHWKKDDKLMHTTSIYIGYKWLGFGPLVQPCIGEDFGF